MAVGTLYLFTVDTGDPATCAAVLVGGAGLDTGVPKRFHFDVAVDDVVAAEARCLELGATNPDFQPGADRWTVLIDPAGRPFRIFPASTE